MRSRERVARILDATNVLVFKHGYRRPTVEDICYLADVSVSSFYYFFGDVEAVLVELVKRRDIIS
jgi:AcrR family transcriptional regulator